MTLKVTVLKCRRCEKMCNTTEVFITNLNMRDETWRCLACGGVCDAFELGKQSKQGAGSNRATARGRAE